MTEHLSSSLGAEKRINLRSVESLSGQDPGMGKPPITATSFIPIDQRRIPTRQWLYDRHMIRAYASATITPSGIGKSSPPIAEALAIATGRPLLSIQPTERANIWIWNGEDHQKNSNPASLRHTASCNDRQEILGRLFLDLGCEQELIIAETRRMGTPSSHTTSSIFHAPSSFAIVQGYLDTC
ncbi:AAA family ATPase [Beijerinckia mobilis]|uniref:AAA family ATPase n=1 Tax=Beijerinckia mobilis TaxID=231434 RepID=UPI000A074AA5|nr:AAA family ATPase [Beijerinckia mobilis]